MSKLNLSVAIGDYDRNRPLIDGAVQIDGVDPVFMKLYPEEIFFRAFRSQDFDISECSLSSYTVNTADGQQRLCRNTGSSCRGCSGTLRCIPHRPHREAGGPEGQEVGLPEYQLTADVWVRAILQDDFGVKPSDIHWIRGGIEEPGGRRGSPSPAGGRATRSAPDDKTLSAMLLAARSTVPGARAPSVHAPRTSAACSAIRSRPPPTYSKRTGMFPIMHLIGIRRTLAEKHPWLPVEVLKAFEQSKAAEMEHR